MSNGDKKQDSKSPNQKAVDDFGAMLMKQVRDNQIELWDQTLSGKVKYKNYQQVHEKLAQTLDPAQLALVQRLTVWVIDDVIAHFLAMLEENDEIDVTVHLDGKTVPSLRDAIDGLEAALYGEDGWIIRFSKMKPTDVAYFTEDVPLD